MTVFGDVAAVDGSISTARLGPDRLTEAVDRRADEMQRMGIGHGVLVADRRGPPWRPDAVNIATDVVARAIERHAGIFSGAMGIDPDATRPRDLRVAVETGFVAAHIVPHAYGLAPDDRRWYPTYAACAELGIVVQVELGVHETPGSRLKSVGRPIALDTVACEFPELKVVAIGPWPWTEEAISVTYKHPNVYLAVGGDDPGARDGSLVRFADSWGRGKVLFASGGSHLASATATVESFALRSESVQPCLSGVARQLGLAPQ